jgi:hypothetical protein
MEVSSLSIVHNFDAPQLVLGVTPPLEDDHAIKLTLQPVQWKNTLHPGSTKAATERRLFTRSGMQCPSCASGGRLQRRRLTACVVVMQSPPGWMTVMLSWGLAVAFARACGVRSMHDAAVSTRAIS